MGLYVFVAFVWPLLWLSFAALPVVPPFPESALCVGIMVGFGFALFVSVVLVLLVSGRVFPNFLAAVLPLAFVLGI